MTNSRINADLFACGLQGLPDSISHNDCVYRKVCLFKHDFFAATGMYEMDPSDLPPADGQPRKVVLKFNRRQAFCGIPLAWLGKGLRNHEVKILQSLRGIEQVPRFLGCYHDCGFLYEFIEGRSLDEAPELPDTFFEELQALLEQVHQRGICYLDMNKRGNILIGSDQKPYLIDFQISVSLGRRWKGLCRTLQREDRYHLYKHKRKFRPDLLTEEEKELSRRKSGWIRAHRLIATPLRKLRRRLLGWLVQRGSLCTPEHMDPSPENDLSRYNRS